jgi:hydrogenase expression/formation protein HypC
MCLAIPMRIAAIQDGVETITSDGLEQHASLALVPDAGVGDYVLVHAGYALTVLDEAEARERLSLFAELEQMDEDADG